MHAVVARLDEEGAAGDGGVSVGMDGVVARIQRKAAARDVERGFKPCLFGTVAGGFQTLAAVGVCQRIVPHAVALPRHNIKGAAVDVQRGICLNAVAVDVDVKGAAVDRDGACGIRVDRRSLGLVRRVGGALDAVACGFDHIGSLIDDDTAVAGDAVVDRSACGRRAVVFRVAADVDRAALVEDQRGGGAALDTVLRVGNELKASAAAEGHNRAALDLDRRAFKGVRDVCVGGCLICGILVVGERRGAF